MYATTCFFKRIRQKKRGCYACVLDTENLSLRITRTNDSLEQSIWRQGLYTLWYLLTLVPQIYYYLIFFKSLNVFKKERETVVI